ncbi:hypothetical protein L228DRAFT_246190 [Xylona heveae TC161]|uniref:Uncharacterized protein n=1 Tax=Xylona heveae (strain CBS 132557 / TC161) TaxID=1328760 RepID=A0A165HF60_XYLHT|nr:hypothetical protein L228DRAFT_246190 [Xylona heveae TC161]KZF23418.1 hypothetical protein L228DRAFT_246190 [Xylona heveae TC161]
MRRDIEKTQSPKKKKRKEKKSKGKVQRKNESTTLNAGFASDRMEERGNGLGCYKRDGGREMVLRREEKRKKRKKRKKI